MDAFTKLLEHFPPHSGMAIILVQHLDPAHESMMVSLLAPHTKMTVCEAASGVRIEPNHVYVIAPGTSIAVRAGALVITEPKERHGARKPFDFLLRSVAEAYGPLAIGVVLSGNGADGSLGLMAIKDHGGLVVAQDPKDAANSGMPQSAIDTGAVDLILPIAKMPESLTTYAEQVRSHRGADQEIPEEDSEQHLSRITDLLREQGAQDFRAYKPGTLMRRIRRRMAIRAIPNVDDYIAFLGANSKEVEVLAKDLLIHVTGFFRDVEVFDFLAATVIPRIVRDHPLGQPIRIWVPACSSGEEVYSLAMLFLEEIAAAKKNIKLQMFASDVDEQAVIAARLCRTSSWPITTFRAGGRALRSSRICATR